MIKNLPKSLIETAERILNEAGTWVFNKEDPLVVKHREAKTPQEHFKDVVNEHMKMGWEPDVNDNGMARSFQISGRGCYKSIKMKHTDGRIANISMSFNGSPNNKHKSYTISRTIQTLLDKD